MNTTVKLPRKNDDEVKCISVRPKRNCQCSWNMFSGIYDSIQFWLRGPGPHGPGPVFTCLFCNLSVLRLEDGRQHLIGLQKSIRKVGIDRIDWIHSVGSRWIPSSKIDIMPTNKSLYLWEHCKRGNSNLQTTLTHARCCSGSSIHIQSSVKFVILSHVWFGSRIVWSVVWKPRTFEANAWAAQCNTRVRSKVWGGVARAHTTILYMCFVCSVCSEVCIQREPQPEVAVSWRKMVTFVTWPSSRTEFLV